MPNFTQTLAAIKMKEVLYNEKDKSLINVLLENPPSAIWYNFTSYVFTYPEFYIEISVTDEVAATQNDFDEILFGKISKTNGSYSPNEHSELVCENKPITKAYILRTFLYFDTFRNFSQTEKKLNRISNKIKSLFSKKKDPLNKILADSEGVGAEYTCNPESEQAKQADPRYSNLIDAGVLLEIEGKYLKAYTENNGFGFHVWDNKYLHEISELQEEREFYKFIEVH